MPANDAVGVIKVPDTKLNVDNPPDTFNDPVTVAPLTTVKLEDIVKDPVIEWDPVKYAKLLSSSSIVKADPFMPL